MASDPISEDVFCEPFNDGHAEPSQQLGQAFAFSAYRHGQLSAHHLPTSFTHDALLNTHSCRTNRTMPSNIRSACQARSSNFADSTNRAQIAWRSRYRRAIR